MSTSVPTSTNTAPENGGSYLRQGWIAVGLAFLVPLLFGFYTDHVWEDYYITFRASKNLAEGNGLVYQIGERVHSFTSPLGALLPAGLSFLTHSDTATLWCFRGICAAALAGAVLLLWHALAEAGAPLVTRWLVVFLVIAESKTVDFTINGMESSLMIFLAAALFRQLLHPGASSTKKLGLVLAALMWTRPDAFVVTLALVGASLIFRPAGSKLRWAYLLKSAGWGALLYAPWFIWATWYYGSPVPHTIIAKAGAAPGIHGVGYLFLAPWHYLTGNPAMVGLLNPSNYTIGDWPELMTKTSGALAIIAGFLWLVRTLPSYARIASFALFIGSYYLQAIPPAPWYFPVWSMLAAIALGTAGAMCIARWKGTPVLRTALTTIIAFALLVQSAAVVFAALQYRAQQTIIENEGRRAIGEWLHENGQPTDTVFLEPLGYIGYFSQMHMLDYPGLCAPSVVRARRESGRTYEKVIATLQPTWLVLRPAELILNGLKDSKTIRDYSFVRAWDARERLAQIEFLPGRRVIDFDSRFLVYRRKQ